MTASRTKRDIWSRRARVEPGTYRDGDTVTLWIDDGRDGYSRERNVRLENVWAPELDELGGPETAAYVDQWLNIARVTASDPDWPLVVTTVRTRTDRDRETLGRYVYQVEDEDGWSLNEAIQEYVIGEGYGGGIGS